MPGTSRSTSLVDTLLPLLTQHDVRRDLGIPEPGNNRVSVHAILLRARQVPFRIFQVVSLKPTVFQTRSGRDFASWDGSHVTPANPEFDLKSLLQAGIEREDLLDSIPAQDIQDYPELSLPELALPLFPPSVQISLPSDDASAVSPRSSTSQPSPLDHLTGEDRRRARAKLQSRKNRSLHRDSEKVSSFSHHTARPKVTQKYVVADNACDTYMCTDAANVARTGYVGLDDGERSKRTYKLDELVGPESMFKFKLLKYKAGTPIPLVSQDNEKYIIGVVAGIPEKDDWPRVIADAMDSLEDARRRCSVPHADLEHRRGHFVTIRCGVSHGGGQTRPSNLSNNDVNAQIADELNRQEPFDRMAGFATSVLATWFPKLYDYYVDRLGALHAHYPTLRRNFTSSVFAATTYNLGPQTTCYRHFDFANLPFGMCAVTALGNYDYTKGGHLILWEAHLVIEFPPGVTILLPSAIISHSNTAIGPHERRQSFTQYTAGGLFRWVENDFQTSTQKRASLTRKQLKQYEQRAKQRWAFGLSLLPQLDDIETA